MFELPSYAAPREMAYSLVGGDMARLRGAYSAIQPYSPPENKAPTTNSPRCRRR